MIIGDPFLFAIESEITYAYERLSQRALGYFVLHVSGHSYGVKAWDATMLGVSFHEVAKRIAGRGGHQAEMISSANASEIAMAYRVAVYSKESQNGQFFGMSGSEFGKFVHSRNLVWEGDEAFDDGSYILQFDIEDQVRLLAFRSAEDSLVEEGSLREIWIKAHDFYEILRQWHKCFEEEWTSLPKVSGSIQ